MDVSECVLSQFVAVIPLTLVMFMSLLYFLFLCSIINFVLCTLSKLIDLHCQAYKTGESEFKTIRYDVIN